MANETQAANQSLRFLFFKRLFDVSLGLTLLMMVAPLVLVILLWRRPQKNVYFVQITFVGLHEKILQKLQIAPIPANSILRFLNRPWLLCSPALLSVISGKLSLVGPRALSIIESAEIERRSARLTVKPGLVCVYWLRQRSHINFRTEEEEDLDYIRTQSIPGDLAILARALLISAYGKPVGSHSASQTIAGIQFLNIAMEELIFALMVAVKNKVSTKIAFVNPDCVNIAAVDVEYRRCLNASDWVCADGIGMQLAGRILGKEVRQNINGTDLFPSLCAALEGSEHAIYLLGAQHGVAEQVGKWLAKQYPRLSIAGMRSGYFSPAEESEVIAAIRNSGADILFVAMGAPRQEKWLDRHLASTGAVIGIGVGGLFDFYSGKIPRAPIWLRELGGEWIFRLMQEPRRMWKRYLIGNVAFLIRIFHEKFTSSSTKGATK